MNYVAGGRGQEGGGDGGGGQLKVEAPSELVWFRERKRWRRGGW